MICTTIFYFKTNFVTAYPRIVSKIAQLSFFQLTNQISTKYNHCIALISPESSKITDTTKPLTNQSHNSDSVISQNQQKPQYNIVSVSEKQKAKL